MTLEEFTKSIIYSTSTANCPVSKTLTLLSGKWTSRVIYELQKQEHIRFSSLKKNLDGITNTMLSSTLKNLEEKGIITRTQYNEIPSHTEYSLTEAGKAMLSIFYEMKKWGERYL